MIWHAFELRKKLKLRQIMQTHLLQQFCNVQNPMDLIIMKEAAHLSLFN